MARSDSRVLPPLLYVFREANRLNDAKKPLDQRDADGARIISGRKGLARHPVSEAVLQAEVAANLAAILNTVHLEATEDLSETPAVARSILNFGIEDLTRLTLDDVRIDAVADNIRRALLRYEPRLLPASITVVRERKEREDGELSVRFRVQADLIASPLNIPVEYIAEADREHARFRLEGA